MRRDGDMHDSTAVAREDEHEQQATGGRRDDEEIGGDDLLDVIAIRSPETRPPRSRPFEDQQLMAECEDFEV
jgi:hypothetical protein